MKKIFCFMLTVVLGLSALSGLTGCTARENRLIIYNWSEYMAPSVIKDFEKWYEEETGEKVKVTEATFDSNELMLQSIEGKEDYDLVCPSDYMIERMIKKDLLLPVDKEILDINDVIKEEYLEISKYYDPTQEYAVPYMYGTFGIMYDYSKTKKHIDSWDSLFTSEFSGKTYMKEAPRDTFTTANIYANKDELARLSSNFTDYNQDYQTKLQKVFEDTNNIDNVKKVLLDQKKHVYKYDVDNGKFDMAGGTTEAILGLFWSCDAGYVMGEYEVDGETYPGNRNLWYTVPKEGGNVYVDSFVIPKYAENVKAANYFLKYLCLQDVAMANSYETGAISPVKSAYEALLTEFSEADYTDADAGWKEMYLDMMFPSAQTLKRCGIMKDFGEAEGKIISMVADIVKS